MRSWVMRSWGMLWDMLLVVTGDSTASTRQATEQAEEDKKRKRREQLREAAARFRNKRRKEKGDDAAAAATVGPAPVTRMMVPVKVVQVSADGKSLDLDHPNPPLLAGVPPLVVRMGTALRDALTRAVREVHGEARMRTQTADKKFTCRKDDAGVV